MFVPNAFVQDPSYVRECGFAELVEYQQGRMVVCSENTCRAANKREVQQ